MARKQKRIYLFEEGKAEMRMLLGNKGANLAEMTNLGLPVPPGFTITTEVCREYYRNGGKLPEGLMDEVRQYMAKVEKKVGGNSVTLKTRCSFPSGLVLPLQCQA